MAFFAEAILLVTSPDIPPRRRLLLWFLYYGGLLVIHLLYIHGWMRGGLYGDEWRYTYYANNLIQGYYSPPEAIFIWNGPGYPFFLVPIAAFEIPWPVGRYLNALLLVGAVAYFRHTVALFARPRWAALAGLALGLYPPLVWHLSLLYSEALATLLLTGFAYHFLRAIWQGRTRHLLAAGLFVGALALTKVVFGPALLVWGLLGGIGVLVRHESPVWKRSVAVAVLGLALCVPYLTYNYQVTGRVFYWGSAMGMSLYFMSSPHPGELGDWYNPRQVRKVPALEKNHLETLERIGRFKEVPEDSSLGELHFLCTDDADQAFRELAFQNIRAYPWKYFENWLANVSRLFFEAPFSYSIWPRKPSIYVINVLLLLLFLLSTIIALRDRRRIDAAVLMTLSLGIVALGGNSLISAVARYSAPVMPLLGLWCIFILSGGRASRDAPASPSTGREAASS